MKQEKMDTITISNLKVATTIGCYEWERQIKQNISLNIELRSNTALAAETDDISHAVDYAQVAELLTQFIESSQFKLLETLAERAADYLLEKFKLSGLQISISKAGVISNADKVTITIERHRNMP